jgi:predicted nucleic acid-binding protein
VTIVDTTVWVDYFRGVDTLQTSWLDRSLGTEAIALTDVILCEILQGVRDERTLLKLQQDLAAFPVVLNGGVEVATAAAAYYRTLRQRGRTVRGTIDCLIATVCLLRGHQLLHSDRDYDAFEEELGLTVLHPSVAY